MSKFRYPCTGNIGIEGFGVFLESNIREPRANMGAFARELGKTFDAERVTLFNSGSSANLVAAMALAEKVRSAGRPLEAITAAYTAPTTLSSLIIAGFNVRLADTEKNGFNLCPLALKKMLDEKPASLICVTHLLGFPAQIDTIMPLARKAGAYVLQDACEAMDLRTADGRQMHTLGDMTTWSFYHPHHLSSYGGGGVVSATDELHRLTDSISHWGRACSCLIDPAHCTAPAGFAHNFTYLRLGLNVEMSELNACFGRFQLQHWLAFEEKRHQRYAVLYDALKDVKALQVYPAPANNGSPFVFPITCRNETAISATQRLARIGIESRSLMGGTMVTHPAFSHLVNDGNNNARELDARSFFVGIHQTLPIEDVRTTATLLRREFE